MMKIKASKTRPTSGPYIFTISMVFPPLLRNDQGTTSTAATSAAYSAANPMSLCVPSQNGLFFEPPQRHNDACPPIQAAAAQPSLGHALEHRAVGRDDFNVPCHLERAVRLWFQPRHSCRPRFRKGC